MLHAVKLQDVFLTLISVSFILRQRVPPKTLLTLVDDPERATNMTLLQPLSSLDATTTNKPCARAKMASGVPVLMATQQPSDLQWTRHFGPPPIVVRPKAKRQKLKKRVRTFIRRIRKQHWLNQLAVAWLLFIVLCWIYQALAYLHGLVSRK